MPAPVSGSDRPAGTPVRGNRYSIVTALIVAFGGFLMGFDASVIAGVVGYVEIEFALTKIELGWAVSSLTLAATVAMLVSGPLSDRFGRRSVLMAAALLFATSAVLSALASSFAMLVMARMLGGIAVGASLIVAPMHIAEMAPAPVRGRMVSLNQLNIVIGISAAFFSNYLILSLAESAPAWAGALRLEDWSWRWMLGIEALPAVAYLAALQFVPESPRWLVMQRREDEARSILVKIGGEARAAADLRNIHDSLAADQRDIRAILASLFRPKLRRMLLIGVSVGLLQQVTGINAVFFYAPVIFEQSGIGTNAAFMQAILVGLVNLVFTVLAMLLIDRLGRRPLLAFGLGGIAACMLTLAWAFGAATYRMEAPDIAQLPAELERSGLSQLAGESFASDVAFREAVTNVIGEAAFNEHAAELVSAAAHLNATLVLLAILGFVASFALSVGPVMWVLFSELFPNRVRGVAISIAGFVNSAVAFIVTFVFPWELQTLGSAVTFLIYGLLALAGLALVLRILPETRGRSLEDLERDLLGA